MSFQVYPQPDACRALMPTPEPHPPGPPSRPMACHMPKGHDGPHALVRRPGPIDRRWEGDARPDRPAPSPAAAGLPAEDVERVARALWTADVAGSVSYTWHDVSEGAQRKWLRLAAAALAEMRPTAAEEAVKRVEVLAQQYARDPLIGAAVASAIRHAIAPVPHGADGGEQSESRSNPSNPYPLTRSPWSPR